MPLAHQQLDLIFWGLFVLAFGLCLLRLRRLRRAARGGRLSLAVAVSLLLIGVLEAGLRLYGERTAAGQAFVGHPLDPLLGWSGIERHGSAPGARVLVIGDSITAAPHVDPGTAYEARLEQELSLQPVVFAASGWGTLQETLVLERELARARPRLVVLQICANDFINNSWELERAAGANNNASLRPYWEDGRVVSRYPGLLLGPAHFLASRSALAALCVARAQRLRTLMARRGWLHTVEADIGRQGLAFPPFERALRTTEVLVARFRERCGEVPLVAVPGDDFEPYAGVWHELLERQRVAFLDDAVRRLRQARARGEAVVLPDGAHWNTRGHRIVGDALVDWIRAQPWAAEAGVGPPS